MKTDSSKLLPSIAATILCASLAGPMSVMAQTSENWNTTIQEGEFNTNDSYQIGDSNDNATYQSGLDNANRTRQYGNFNWNETGQFGDVNYNQTDQSRLTDHRGESDHSNGSHGKRKRGRH